MDSRELMAYLSVKYKGNFHDILNAIKNKEKVDENEVKDTLSKLKSNYITFSDKEYPFAFKSIKNPPLVLFYQGDISLLDDDKLKLAVIGSRMVSQYGKDATTKIVSDLSNEKENPLIIVSGLARGVDTIAHSEALKHNSKTIAVVANGIDVCYPPENKQLQDEIAKNGLVISEYPDGVEPRQEHFIMRNRIVAGLSDKVLITEGKIQSGSALTCMFAKKFNREVLAIPRSIFDNNIKIDLGNALIKNGEATLINDSKDIVLMFYNSQKCKDKRIFKSVNKNDKGLEK